MVGEVARMSSAHCRATATRRPPFLSVARPEGLGVLTLAKTSPNVRFRRPMAMELVLDYKVKMWWPPPSGGVRCCSARSRGIC